MTDPHPATTSQPAKPSWKDVLGNCVAYGLSAVVVPGWIVAELFWGAEIPIPGWIIIAVLSAALLAGTVAGWIVSQENAHKGARASLPADSKP